MRLSRLLLPVFLALALLSGQAGAAAHALSHVLGQIGHQDKQAPHSTACEQCAAYAQLGSALHVGGFNLAVTAPTGLAALHRPSSFLSVHSVAAAARGPPRPTAQLI